MEINQSNKRVMRAVQGTDCIDPCCESECGREAGLTFCRARERENKEKESFPSAFKEWDVLSCVWGEAHTRSQCIVDI